MSERKAVIKNADMSEDMQQDAIDCATQVTTVVQKCTFLLGDALSDSAQITFKNYEVFVRGDLQQCVNCVHRGQL